MCYAFGTPLEPIWNRGTLNKVTGQSREALRDGI